MKKTRQQRAIDKLAKALEKDLLGLYGPIVEGETLSQLLGYPSIAAFRQAVWRCTIPIQIFTPENRQGKFALVKDIAHWLATERVNSEYNSNKAIANNEEDNDMT